MPTTAPRLVILDRDGVINHDSDAYIKSPDEWQPIDGSLEAIGRLCAAGYRVVVATNQSGIARGLFDLATLGAIHSKMHQCAAQAGGHIDAVFFCPHAGSMQCECRKPKPGMILEILRRYDAVPDEVFFIGDSLRDVQAAAAAQCRPGLVLTGNGRKTQDEDLPPGIVIEADLASFVDHVLLA